MDANPFLVEVTRGDLVESRHRGRYAVVEVAMGRLLLEFDEFDELGRAALAAMIRPTLANAAGRTIGGLAPAPDW
jgi:L-asparaginase II